MTETKLESLPDRLLMARNRLDLSQQELADAVGMKQPSYYQLESGKTKKSRYIVDIARALGVRVDWLISGDGDMLSESDKILDEIHRSRVEVDYGGNDGQIAVPLYDVVFCCGDGNDIEYSFESIKEIRRLPASLFEKHAIKPENFKLLCAVNDSMQPYINDGDEVGVDISDRAIKDGEVYAILLEGERMFKQVFKEGGGVLRLRSYNNKYPDKLIDDTNGQSLKIIGRQIYRAG